MADLLNKNATPEAMDADAPAPEKKAKKAKKAKVQYLEKNQMNFREKYEVVVEGKKKDVDLSAIIKPIIIVVAVVAVVFVLCEVVLLSMNARTKSLEKYINDEGNIASYNAAVALKQEGEAVKAQKANTESLIKAIDSYPNVDKAFFTAISTAATNNGVTVNNYGYSGVNGYLSVSCNSTTTSGISNFVRAMVDTGLFATVEYNQFNSGGTEGGYAFSVTCYCNGTEAK